MFVLKSVIDKYTKQNGKLYACFVDLRKAFDKVWHNGLLYKLLLSGVRGHFYNIIKNMYQNINSCVKTKFGITPSFEVFQGVRQGEVMSPSLFSIYINDLPKEIGKNHNDPVSLGCETIPCLLFADDLVLLSSSQSGLQTCINNLDKYCKTWKLEINLSKTKIIIFNKTGRLLTEHFHLGNTPIECVKSYRYLGITFSNSGSFNLAISELKVKASKACFKLKTILDSNNFSPKVAMGLFHSLIKPILLYGADIWGVTLCAPSVQKVLHKIESSSLEKVQLNFAKYILRVHKKTASLAVYGELGIQPIGIDALICMHK